jgi:hypothetical protein
MSHLHERFSALWRELTGEGVPFVFAYMNTPIDICIKRVKQRRLDKGNVKPFNTQNTISHYDATWKTKEKFDAEGIDTCIIDYMLDPVIQIKKLLKRDSILEFSNSYREESFRKSKKLHI